MTTEGWIIVAAEIASGGLDFAQDPMVTAGERELDAAGVKNRPEVVLANGTCSNAGAPPGLASVRTKHRGRQRPSADK
ncbi:hypothetical protein C8250_008865 [Streptomyces sp. So13.3]|uniref:hypothetical protein n=1 Tax=Streptomyces sp. So13.3 TaxID=2136173 RepID=UPI001105C4E4|nr:hypothetical protein [Streptomyces sp. So13.3]QNA71998.1 hypothetical protein C8250_008865 [Streptomyces sp. So13.3]